ncbi:AraC family transcriptional regulator [Salipaludibacillus agaradhaerens]|uniref:AraC family transcriptional regulator n=1 Tax=Salipaludibacillus agaradhaerens TaxID=76935 RepID=UPI002151D9EE|nr:AraC family transcriptional regulator [Salipaludibacillus agaradhaerens]MCR6105072.1 AraC family transcriptional regulator [Salipaludibacillus agaradhaerens]MCR6109161.1 AraC family transcriptional regulator [Bacillus sp. A301a_S52]MCR6117117.1 AraC family transcriptional regulator [Salipaludibacillus agaradhaerens]UJW56315.1 AraC family transcriptional regulator [Bacillus sp. A116_S68]
MESLDKMNEAMAYIEEHLTEMINFKEVARIACCSEYHFKRMFSFLAGVTLSEYIRRRRLTMAALTLRETSLRVIDVAMMYGYQSPDAFARAFQAVHDVTPSDVRTGDHSLKAFPKMTFQLTIKGGNEMNYRLEAKEPFRLVGVKQRVSLIYRGENREIASLWKTLSEEAALEIKQLSNTTPSGLLSVCTNFSEGREDGGTLDYYIAAATTKAAPDHLSVLEVPALTWAIFEVEAPYPEALQETWGQIYSEWFPTSLYEAAEGPEILWHAEEEKEDVSTHKSAIWIPVQKQRDLK